ncbi:hypothetical protein LTS18_000336 [Coniosporium uncinatum]|uniref:Uncharacterized protein n=1 Tax=Coniosporium uncinatum TaxID=93489 RepID=A0ACC3D876_9PEZI|nr:hypothetical protein LTS18_000336 [Coniosporium uncinatum]
MPQSTSLADLAAQTSTLLTHFLGLLTVTPSEPPSSTAHSTTTTTISPQGSTNNVNPDLPVLSVLRDSASLLKAHTTKLGLLLINKPFTPSAVEKVLREVSGTCLPTLMGAVEACRVEKWGETVGAEVRARVARVLRAFQETVAEVGRVAGGGAQVGKSGVVGGMERLDLKSVGKGRREGEKGKEEVLASTGMVWESCDALVELERVGVVGLVVKKAEEWREMLADAMEELKEWGQDDGEDNEEDDEFDGAFSDDDSLGKMMVGGKIPKDNEELKALLQQSLKKLKLIETLYKALAKRRLKTFPFDSQVQSEPRDNLEARTLRMRRLDEVLRYLRTIPETVDDMASRFYESDIQGVDAHLAACCKAAESASETARMDWAGQEDLFTSWGGKWAEAIGT